MTGNKRSATNMTRQLALDAYRYVSRDYANISAQCIKMARRHGCDLWMDATMIAGELYHANRDQCAAVVIGMIEAALAARKTTPIVG